MSVLNPSIINHQLTTFRTLVNAESISISRWPRELYSAYHKAKNLQKAFIILGQGSNVLFVEDFCGEVTLNQYQGIKVQSDKEYFYLSVNSGVTIDHLIAYCHRFKIYGLENLSLIPSSVGTAVISNIGAYGIEFEQFVDYVIMMNLDTGEQIKLNHDQCQFSYRNSIFKTQYQQGYAILTVGLRIPKKYTPVLTYSPLNTLNPETVSPKEVQRLVVETRRAKLPDFDQTGNAGSFFCNPVIDFNQFAKLKEKYPNIVSYTVNDELVKISAGWLIEQAGLKGFRYGNAGVSSNHALILVNLTQNASGYEVAKVAAHVQHIVEQKFGIKLVPEVRFIGKYGEVNAVEFLENITKNDPIN